MFAHLIPQPVKLEALAGTFSLTPATAIVASGEAVPTARQLAGWLAQATGFGVPVQTELGSGQPGIHLQLDPALKELGSEGYRMRVTPQGADLVAANPAGLFYAAQTMRQLFPPALFSATPVAGVDWAAPGVAIEDYPRFGWRGAMLDASRHFMPVEFVERFIDLLAMHKLNVFHWHLTDDQGWRIEIKKYPRLTEIGAWRSETLTGRMVRGRTDLTFDGIPHGGFYTQADVRRVIEYARQRHVWVLPEIEVPGHAQAAIAAYPEFGMGVPVEVGKQWGIMEYDVFNPSEATFQFLENIFGEVTDLFPGEFIHVGGDEVLKKAWHESPQAQARIKELALKDEHELQSYFIRRMGTFLTSRGRRLIGWDEILEGGLAPNATVMAWRGEAGGIAAALAGHDVVMAPNTYTYFDYFQAEERAAEPLAIGGYLPLSKVYSYNPIPVELAGEQAHHVLGTQFQLWSEYMPTPAQVEYMAFPRACALSEVAWSPLAAKNWERFTGGLAVHLQRLDGMKINYRSARWE